MNRVPSHIRQRAAAEPRRYTTHRFPLSAAIALLAIFLAGAARGDLTKEADGVLARLAELQKTVDRARDDDVFFSADMPVPSDLRHLVGVTRAELLEHLGRGRVCTEDGGRGCVLWAFCWKPFSTRLTGASPALVAIFDVKQRCTDIHVATMD